MNGPTTAAMVEQVQDLLPELSRREAHRQAVLLQGGSRLIQCPIASQQKDPKAGYSFEVGPRGNIRLQAAVDGQWQTCTSEDWVVPMRKWIHIVGVYDAISGLWDATCPHPLIPIEIDGTQPNGTSDTTRPEHYSSTGIASRCLMLPKRR